MPNSLRSRCLAVSLITTLSACKGSTDPIPPTDLALTSRVGHVMVYDEARRQLLLFGGIGAEGPQGSAERNSTWTWDGQRWSRISTTGPSPRYLASAVYDAARQRVVLYGGESGLFPNTSILSDTWEWDGSTWSQRATTGPSPRVHQSMAYDRTRGRVVLYGGFNTSTNAELHDIWEWNGSAWTLQSVSAPSDLIARGVAFDERANVLTLISVTAVSTSVITHVWNGTSLTPIAEPGPACIPPASTLVSLGPVRGGVFFYAGGCGATGTIPESWRWDGTAWLKLGGTQPDFRMNAAMAYDRDRDRVVLYGGEVGPNQANLADTWEFDGSTWTRR